MVKEIKQHARMPKWNPESDAPDWQKLHSPSYPSLFSFAYLISICGLSSTSDETVHYPWMCTAAKKYTLLKPIKFSTLIFLVLLIFLVEESQ